MMQSQHTNNGTECSTTTSSSQPSAVLPASPKATLKKNVVGSTSPTSNALLVPSATSQEEGVPEAKPPPPPPPVQNSTSKEPEAAALKVVIPRTGSPASVGTRAQSSVQAVAAVVPGGGKAVGPTAVIAPAPPPPLLQVLLPAPSHPMAASNFTGAQAFLGFGQPGLVHPSIQQPLVLPSTAETVALNQQPQHNNAVVGNNNRVLRSGKWGREEEEYSGALIALFERGLLGDCENGSTLRAYLSKKLHCPPMRISKKYAGRGIGKLVFLSKVGAELPTLEIRTLEQKVLETEQRFYQASYPCSEYFSATLARTATTASVSSGISAVPGVVPPFTVMPGFGAVPTNTAGLPFGVMSLPPRTATLPQPLFPPTNTMTQVLPQLASAQQTTTEPASNDDQRSQLRQSYLKALLQGQVSITTSGDALQRGLPNNLVQEGNNRNELGGPAPLPWRPSEPLCPAAFVPTAHQGATLPNLQALAPSYIPAMKDLWTGSAAPDFLSGFDNVALSKKASSHSSPQRVYEAPAQATPQFTTRSFDDFHQFLGTDFSQVESSNTETDSKSKSPFPASPRLPNGDTMVPHDTLNAASLCADSYVMFAVETAVVAASQHAAYLPSGAMMGATDNDWIKNISKAESFDVKDAVEMVAEQVGGLVPRPTARTAFTDTKECHERPFDRTQPPAPSLTSSNTKDSQNGSAHHTQTQSAYHSSSQLLQAKIMLDRLHSSMNAALVSSSEPSSSATESAPQSAGSDSGGSSDDSEEIHSDCCSSDASSASGSEGPCRKKSRTCIEGTGIKPRTAGRGTW